MVESMVIVTAVAATAVGTAQWFWLVVSTEVAEPDRICSSGGGGGFDGTAATDGGAAN
ncbi:UNVERIFIED_CONTAM: hypothetical protein Sradi_1255900 [Sesamum radiatum]|uniref:Secreted protein n=1 Tax=Sesamum radiatum TaxID=300843 RepID=A0AAW2UN51_SESRA